MSRKISSLAGSFRPTVEQLETRLAPATHWVWDPPVGSDDSWATGNNWIFAGHRATSPPTSADAAEFNGTNTTRCINASGEVGGILIGSSYTGTITLSGDLACDGTSSIQNNILDGGTVELAGNTLTLAGSNDTWSGTSVTNGSSGGSLTISGTTTTTGTSITMAAEVIVKDGGTWYVQPTGGDATYAFGDVGWVDDCGTMSINPSTACNITWTASGANSNHFKVDNRLSASQGRPTVNDPCTDSTTYKVTIPLPVDFAGANNAK